MVNVLIKYKLIVSVQIHHLVMPLDFSWYWFYQIYFAWNILRETDLWCYVPYCTCISYLLWNQGLFVPCQNEMAFKRLSLTSYQHASSTDERRPRCKYTRKQPHYFSEVYLKPTAHCPTNQDMTQRNPCYTENCGRCDSRLRQVIVSAVLHRHLRESWKLAVGCGSEQTRKLSSLNKCNQSQQSNFESLF